jgi:D-alanine-D-alanine ligase
VRKEDSLKLKVAVLYGGRSGEHEISVRSAESILKGLASDRYEVQKFFISKEGQWTPHTIVPEPKANPGIDVVFPVLHGTFGEDGTVQGLLELADLAYVGPGVLASAAAMDKDVTKRLLSEAGLPVVESVCVFNAKVEIPAIEHKLAYPLFVKPANLGSSVGISKAKDRPELEAAIHLAAQYDRKILVERTIHGQEIECAVIGNDSPTASIPCEILPSRDFYDYDDKYLLDKSEVRIPPALAEDVIQHIREVAVLAYRALQCEGMARVDFLVEATSKKIFINEINTIPGFTSISMYPKMWEHSGLPFPRLLDRLIELALSRHAARKALKYTR